MNRKGQAERREGKGQVEQGMERSGGREQTEQRGSGEADGRDGQKEGKGEDELRSETLKGEDGWKEWRVGDDSNVESRSRIADRDRYYSGRGRKKRVLREETEKREGERERKGRKRDRGKSSSYPPRRFEEHHHQRS